ncbi:MAG TPA: universal stress protein [Baekduia sp.]|uniref:universal stress protein n=1 Tax=Baekduia sp. TaxID=2600305 RepID=UPI002D77DBDF|nr:universal stress protein [Baekduia sp.]HET6508042.1 universal stress protein [Baekduia sp.]
MFRNVLVGLSLTPRSERPLREAIELADQHHGRLTILTVLPECRSCAFGPIETCTAARDVSDDLWRTGQAAQRAALEQVPACLPVSTLLLQGSAWSCLMRELRGERHDSLVVGASGRSRLSRLLHRSFDDRLTRWSPVPVLVVPPEGPTDLYVSRAARRRGARTRLARDPRGSGAPQR